MKSRSIRFIVVAEDEACPAVSAICPRFSVFEGATHRIVSPAAPAFTTDHGSTIVIWIAGAPRAPLVAPAMVVVEGGGDSLPPWVEHFQQLFRWPGELEEFDIKLRKLVRLQEMRRRIGHRATLEHNLVGCSAPFQRVLDEIERFARCDAPVLITGETGTGKEQVARAIHYGGNGERPFVAVNCGAIPDNLFENELFGHVRGAYTDAREAQRGLVELAEGGTLFLDEIESLSSHGQVALLRFLQDYEYRPLGAQQSRRARLRIITATNEPLEHLVAQGRFRRDLYYRINILAIELPPLRQRGEDIVCLAEHFLDKYRVLYRQYDKYLDPETLEWMCRYEWPGNVRELENTILRQFLLADGARIRFGEGRRERRRNPFDRRYRHLYDRTFQEAKSVIVGEFEKSYLRHLLEEVGGNVSEAARRAGKERRTFAKLMEKHGLAREQFLRH